MGVLGRAAALAAVSLALWATPAAAREFEIGAGPLFHAGGSFLTQPSDRTGGPNGAFLPYHGFAGFGPGGGIGLDLRWREVLGLEIDLIRSVDKVTGKSDYQERGSVDIDIEQPALHVPIMLKGVLPAGWVRPSVLAGIELVRPGKATVTQEVRGGLPWNAALAASADPYEMFLFGFGLEFALPIRGIDLRVPVSFRASINPRTPDSARELADWEFGSEGTPTKVNYHTEWQYHAAITAGLFYHFL